MKWLLNKKTAALLTAFIALGSGEVSHAQTFFEDFEGGTAMPATNFFTHDGSAFAGQQDNLVPEGLPGVEAFGGAGGGSIGSAATSLGLSVNGGVGGSQAAVLTLTNDGTTDFAFGGIIAPIGSALAVPTNFIASADVLAPAGYALALRVESAFGPSNNGFALDFVGTGAFQTVSGVIGTDLTAIAGGTFDPSTGASIIVASGNSNIPIGFSQEVFIDNLSITAIPEPTSAAVLMGLSSIIAVGRRRR